MKTKEAKTVLRCEGMLYDDWVQLFLPQLMMAVGLLCLVIAFLSGPLWAAAVGAVLLLWYLSGVASLYYKIRGLHQYVTCPLEEHKHLLAMERVVVSDEFQDEGE